MRRRNKFNLSNYKLTTCDMGELVPIGIQEVLPGDTFQHSTNVLIRLSPLAAPVMHPVSVRVHHFFVPNRLIWEAAGGTGTWEDFITSGKDGTDAQTVPTWTNTGTSGEVMDYYGIPTHAAAAGVDVNVLPLVGYNNIANEYYLDQDLNNVRGVKWTSLAKCAWEKDYLTSARPWPQKGPDITLPVAGKAPIFTDAGQGQALTIKQTSGGSDQYMDASGASLALGATGNPNDDQGLFADLSASEAVKVNEFRRAFALQRYAEARARYGSRFTEYLRYHGITPSDARLDRPEFLGGGRAQVSISEVLQTAPEGTGRAFGVGDMYGHGVAAMRSNAYRRFFEEHGYVHTLLSVRPKAMYNNAIDRHWLRATRDEYWQSELQHIGQQTVENNEVWADSVNGTNIFGYQDRYREYRESNSHVTGEFRDTLNYWHLARDFASAPALNETFVSCTPSKRIFNEQTQDSLWVMAQHKIVARRLVARTASNRIM